MRYTIVYDTPGRLRVRCGQYAFSKEQGCGITSLLLSQKEVLGAQAHPSNGSILITYQPGGRKDILALLFGLTPLALPAADVSVAIKDSSDLAREVADITLPGSDQRAIAQKGVIKCRP